MANTVIALKKSGTPSSVPTNLANGELAINYADGKLYYKAANGTIASISGNEPNYFGTVNANNTLVVADTPGDVFTLASGKNIAITGDAIDDKITIGLTNDVTIDGSFTINAAGGDEGGEIKLANAITNSVLSGKVVIDIYQNKLRFFEESGTNRGAFIDLSAASGGVATDLLASSGSVDSTARQWATGAFGQANNAYAQANAAYDAANNAVTDFSPAFIQANTARVHANVAFASANAGQTTANAAFDKANIANITADLAFIHANAAFAKANSANVLAYNTGIGANSYAETIGAAANTIAIAAFNQANNAYDAANNAVTDFSPAFIQANLSYEQANTARDHANAAFLSSNSVNTYSDSIYVKLSASSQTITGNLSIVGGFSVSGNTTIINADSLKVSDPLIYLAGNNYVSDIVDIGFIANYVNVTGQNVHTGLYREHEDKEYYLFQGYDKEPTNNHIGALSNNMTLAVLNADLRTSNLILGGANAILTIGASFNQANAAYNAANNAVTDFSPAFLQANIAYAHANASFSKANAALPNTSGVAFNGNLNLPTGNLAVGIATPNTGARLQVYNTSGNSELWITADNGYDPTLRLTGEAGEIGNEGFSIRYDNSVGDTYFENKFGAVTSYHFLTSVVEALTIHTDGKVGVGETSPQHILDVKGTANVSSSLLVNDMNVKPTIQAAFNRANTANITADLAYNKANTANITADRAWNHANAAFDKANNALANTAGISTAGALVVPGILTSNIGGGGLALRAGGTSNHVYIEYYPRSATAGRGAYVGYGSAGSNNFSIINETTTGILELGTVSGADLTIDVAGQIGIGRSDPGYKLDIVGVANASNVLVNQNMVLTTQNFSTFTPTLSAISGLAVTDGNFIVGNGTTWVAENGATARTSLGLGTIATQSAASVAITGGSITGITDLAVADGGTGASDAATARTNLGLAIGTNVQAYSARLAEIAALTPTADNFIVGNGTSWVLETPASARTSLGLGTIATQASSSVSITGGSISGITDLAVADGGTGASDAATARTNLGLAIGTNVQAYSARLAEIAALAPTADNFIVGNGTSWTLEAPATVRTSLSIATTNNVQFNGLGVGTAASATTGEIRATNEITAYFTSDIKFKTNIEPIKNASYKIKQINGVMFDWKDDYIESRGGEDGYFVRKHDTGVIAQEIETVLPEVVAMREDGTKAVRYEKLVPLLIEALKDALNRIEILENKK